MANGKKTATTAVVEKKDQLPAYMRQGPARGSEGVESNDISLPRIDVIQDLSPQHKESKPEYIPGAKPGMLFNTLTNELYPEGVSVVPVWYHKEYNVWKDLKKGGGFLGSYPKDQKEEAEQKAASEPDLECVETPVHVVLVINDEGEPLYEATIPMPKSKKKVNRQWNSLIMLHGGDRFSRAYRLTSVEDKNQEGQEYLNFRVALLDFASEAAYLRGEKLYEQLSAGTAKATTNYNTAADGAVVEGEDY